MKKKSQKNKKSYGEDVYTDFPSIEDILGKNNLFSRIFNGDEKDDKPKNDDPRGAAILETFRIEITKGDRNFLEKKVIEYKADVHQRDDNVPLLIVHARASVFVGNNSLGYESLQKIRKPLPGQIQVLGILAYELGMTGEAIKYFRSVEDLSAPARIAYSLSLIDNGRKDMDTHSAILKPILKNSDMANTILGSLALDSGRTDSAEHYLSNAARIRPCERTLLDLMRIKVINGKKDELYSKMSEFYVNTGSKLNAEGLEEQFNTRKISPPRIRMRNLYDVVNSIL